MSFHIERLESKFEINDKIKMKYGNEYYYGHITIIRKNRGMIENISYNSIICKVLFDEALSYWYYPEDHLEKIV